MDNTPGTTAVAVATSDESTGSGSPTLEQIRRWPATVDVGSAAAAFGISRSQAYELIRRGEFPARVITVGRRHRVLTASILRALDPAPEAA